MIQRDIFVVDTARIAIGTFGGALRDVPNTQLATPSAPPARSSSPRRSLNGTTPAAATPW